jgi:hypothetical protein
MPVGMQLPQEAARIWTDPARRERIVAMHAQAMPLTEMCDELGLGPVLDRDGLREIVANLSDDEVQAIRAAFLAEADATPGPGASFPVDCRVYGSMADGVRVVAAAADPNAIGPIARIEPA